MKKAGLETVEFPQMDKAVKLHCHGKRNFFPT